MVSGGGSHVAASSSGSGAANKSGVKRPYSSLSGGPTAPTPGLLLLPLGTREDGTTSPRSTGSETGKTEKAASSFSKGSPAAKKAHSMGGGGGMPLGIGRSQQPGDRGVPQEEVEKEKQEVAKSGGGASVTIDSFAKIQVVRSVSHLDKFLASNGLSSSGTARAKLFQILESISNESRELVKSGKRNSQAAELSNNNNINAEDAKTKKRRMIITPQTKCLATDLPEGESSSATIPTSPSAGSGALSRWLNPRQQQQPTYKDSYIRQVLYKDFVSPLRLSDGTVVHYDVSLEDLKFLKLYQRELLYAQVVGGFVPVVVKVDHSQAKGERAGMRTSSSAGSPSPPPELATAKPEEPARNSVSVAVAVGGGSRAEPLTDAAKVKLLSQTDVPQDKFADRRLNDKLEEKFIVLIDQWEKCTNTRAPISLENAILIANSMPQTADYFSNWALKLIYQHWISRRGALDKPLMRHLWHSASPNTPAAFTVFKSRQRDRMSLRRPRRSLHGAWQRLEHLVADLTKVEAMLKLVIKRDEAKLSLAELNMCLFEQARHEINDPYYVSPYWKYLKEVKFAGILKQLKAKKTWLDATCGYSEAAPLLSLTEDGLSDERDQEAQTAARNVNGLKDTPLSTYPLGINPVTRMPHLACVGRHSERGLDIKEVVDEPMTDKPSPETFGVAKSMPMVASEDSKQAEEGSLSGGPHESANDENLAEAKPYQTVISQCIFAPRSPPQVVFQQCAMGRNGNMWSRSYVGDGVKGALLLVPTRVSTWRDDDSVTLEEKGDDDQNARQIGGRSEPMSSQLASSATATAAAAAALTEQEQAELRQMPLFRDLSNYGLPQYGPKGVSLSDMLSEPSVIAMRRIARQCRLLYLLELITSNEPPLTQTPAASDQSQNLPPGVGGDNSGAQRKSLSSNLSAPVNTNSASGQQQRRQQPQHSGGLHSSSSHPKQSAAGDSKARHKDGGGELVDESSTSGHYDNHHHHHHHHHDHDHHHHRPHGKGEFAL